MTEEEFARKLSELLEENDQWNVRNFADALLMTSAEGLIVHTDDGSEFQVTVIRMTAPSFAASRSR